MMMLKKMKKKTEKKQDYEAKENLFINISPIIDKFKFKYIFLHI